MEAFTPPTLAKLPVPPVFKLRAADDRGREWRKYQFLLRVEGLRFHNTVALRVEVLRGVEALYDPDTARDVAKRLNAFWELTDKGEAADPNEAAAIDELAERLTGAWRPLSQAGADNTRFQDEALRVALSMFLVGWQNVDLPYRREEGRVPLDLLDQLEDKIEALEKQADADGVEGVVPGLAFGELCTAAYRRLRLEEEQEAETPTADPAPTVEAPAGA
jgi:hypothetical protein